VLKAWGTALVKMNPNATTDDYPMTVSMKATGTGFGSTGGGSFNSDGYMTSGHIKMGRGSDGQGAGWFIDPTPDDNSEFTDIINPWAAKAAPGSPAFGTGADFYNFVNAEIAHALGLLSGDPDFPTKFTTPVSGTMRQLTDSSGNPVPDVEDGQGSTYWVYD